MRAAPSAGGPSKMSSKHTGHNGPGVQTGAAATTTNRRMPPVSHSQVWSNLLNWRSAIPKHNRAYSFLKRKEKKPPIISGDRLRCKGAIQRLLSFGQQNPNVHLFSKWCLFMFSSLNSKRQLCIFLCLTYVCRICPL